MAFNDAVKKVLGIEGGYSDDPVDRGGKTNFGISQRANPDIDVSKLTKQGAIDLYKTRYWDAIPDIDSMPADVQSVVFDTAVNHGVPYAQKLVANVGPDTAGILAARRQRYADIIAADPSQAKFKNGWENRLRSFEGGSNGVLSKKTDLSAFEAAGYGEEIRHARSKGWSDAEIAQKLSADSKPPVDTVVTSLAQSKAPVEFMLTKLKEVGYGDEIAYAQSKGWSNDEIVTKLAGPQVATLIDAQKQADSAGALSNVAYGVKDTLQGAALGSKRLIAQAQGDTAAQAALKAAADTRKADPYRTARLDTTGAKVGSFLPNAAVQGGVALATGGASIPAQAAAFAATEAAAGLIDPDVEDADRLGNAGKRAAIGGVAGGVGGLIGKAAPAVVDAGRAGVARTLVGDVDAAAARAAEQQALGLPASLSTVSPRAAAIRNVVDRVPGSGIGGADKSGAFDAAVGRLVNSRAGATGNTIDTTAVREAQQNVGQLYDDALNGVAVDVRNSFGQPLDDLVSAYEKSTLPSMRSSMPRNLVADLKNLAAQGPVDARQLQSIRSTIGAEMSSPSAEASTKQALRGIYNEIDSALQGNLPAANLAKFQQANQQYKNLQALENMVRSSNGTGSVTNRQIISSGKQANKAAFERGNAPYQDVGDSLLQESTGSGPLTRVLETSAGVGTVFNPVTALTAAVPAGLSANMAMRLLTDPKYMSLLQSLTPVQQAAIRRAASTVATPAMNMALQPSSAPQLPQMEVQRVDPKQLGEALRRKVQKQT